MNSFMLKLQANTKNLFKGFFALFMVFTLLGISNVVFGNDSVNLSPVQPITNSSSNQSSNYSNANDKFYETGELPSVPIEDAANFVGGKLGDLIIGLQLIVKPFCVLMAALCIGMSVFGIFGDSALLTRGLLGLFLTAICYFGVMHAPELVGFINNWMSQGTEFLG